MSQQWEIPGVNQGMFGTLEGCHGVCGRDNMSMLGGGGARYSEISIQIQSVLSVTFPTIILV